MKRETEVDLSRRAAFASIHKNVWRIAPSNAKAPRAPLFAERIDTPLGAMIAVADDKGLRLLEFIDRRATERELSVLRKRLETNVVPGKHRHLEIVRAQLKDYFAGKQPAVRCSASPSRLAVSVARLENFAGNPGWRNAFVFLDGEALGRRKRAPRGRSREWHEHDLYHHSVSPRYSRRWHALRLRRRVVAEEMAPRSRTAVQSVKFENYESRIVNRADVSPL